MLRFTLDANAISPDAPTWRPEIEVLIALASVCKDIDVARTAGARRERSRPPEDPDSEARHRLMTSIPGLAEAFTIGLSELDDAEAHLADDWEPDYAERISAALWGRPQAALKHSDLEDVAHLHTHARHKRDVFVTTDGQMLDRAHVLADIGIQVATPQDALQRARESCTPVSLPGGTPR